MLYQYKKHFTSISLLAAALAMSSVVLAVTEFEPPKLDGFNPHVERDADGDGDGVNETHIIQYFDASGDSIVSMSTMGIVWAWSMETRSSNTGDKNYVIRDSNCDGKFDEVYGLDDEFRVPDCFKLNTKKE